MWNMDNHQQCKRVWITVGTVQKVFKIHLLQTGSPCGKKPSSLPNLLFPEKAWRKLQILHKSGHLSAYLCLSSRPWPRIPFDYPSLCLIKGKELGQGRRQIDSGDLRENVWPCLCKSAEKTGEKQQFHNHDGKMEPCFQKKNLWITWSDKIP